MVGDDGLRRELVAVAQRMQADGLAVGAAGNVSVAVGDELLITPGGVAAEQLDADTVAEVAVDGGHVAGPPPSSELPMHRAAYEAAGVGAVVHTHARYATAVACVRDELPAIHYMLATLGESVPVVPYARFGSRELADHVRAGLADRRALLLGHHGTLTVGPTLAQAYDAARTLEWLAQLWITAASVGEPQPLGRQELAGVAARMRELGYLPGEP